MTAVDTKSKLFEELKVGAYTLPNRVVMAPMTRNRATMPGNVPNDLIAKYYEQRASAALIITEATQISADAVGYPATPGVYSEEQIAAWKKTTDAVHANGGRIFLQLWHVGRISHTSLREGGSQPVAPSAIKPAGEAFTFEGPQPFETPRELNKEEIATIVKDFAQAAKNAIEAGFDGVEIHGANGYLLDQFTRDGSNKREDEYGGSLENRVRFPLEVTRAVVDAIGADKVGYRISPTGAYNDMQDSDPQKTFERLVSELDKFNLAYLHVVEFFGAHEDATFDFKRIKDIFKGPYIGNGGYTSEQASGSISAGKSDLISFGAPFLANPDLPRRFKEGQELNAPDQATFYGGDAKGYTDYPFLG